MIKKIILLTVFSILIFSCGKKANPEYGATKNNVLIFKI